jgi:hypothetical protein
LDSEQQKYKEIMLCPSNNFALQLNKYFVEKVIPRKNSIYKAVRDVSKVVTEVLREVEAQEPRFISSLNELNGRFEGLSVVSHTEFEVRNFTTMLHIHIEKLISMAYLDINDAYIDQSFLTKKK